MILTNLDTKEIVDVLKTRTQEKLRARLEQLSPCERAQIQEVAIDMWNPYDTVCAELLPHTVITADRFHVMQAVNRELKQLKNQQKKVYPHALKGVHYALLKNRQDLTHKQQAALEHVYQVSPLVKTAHRLIGSRSVCDISSSVSPPKKRRQSACESGTSLLRKQGCFRNSVEHWQTGFTGLPTTFVTAPQVAWSKASTIKSNSSNAGLLDFATLNTFESGSLPHFYS